MLARNGASDVTSDYSEPNNNTISAGTCMSHLNIQDNVDALTISGCMVSTMNL